MSRKEYMEKTGKLFEQIKPIAKEYYAVAKRPLGITGEIAEYEAARLLKLYLDVARTPGYDAVLKSKTGDRKIQIKGRVVHADSKRGQRVGSIDRKKPWDDVYLVLMDSDFNATAIYKADRATIITELDKAGSVARNERGQLSVEKFKSVAEPLYPKSLYNAYRKNLAKNI